jgi:predicted DNA-binding transcriptional regulator YafY
MATRRSREALIQQWSLVEQLSRSQRGVSVEQMRDHTRASRSTVYRDLGLLCEAGVQRPTGVPSILWAYAT